MQHQVRSKPLIGFLGFFTSVLAVLAGFGLACYLGVRFNMMLMIMLMAMMMMVTMRGIRVFVLAGFGLGCYLGVRFTMMMNNGGGDADDGCQDHDNHNQQKFCLIIGIMLTINGNQEDML